VTEPSLVERARRFAADVHAGDTRKGTDPPVPYFAGHLEPVADLVRASGGTDVQIAAAYLHDAAEDHGGQVMLDRIRAEFGEEVATIVFDLSDSLVDTSSGEEKAPWPERKAEYRDRLRTKAHVSLEVSVADKLHNARSILEDHRTIGDDVWSRFNEQDPEAQLRYYRSLADVFADRMPDHPLTGQLVDVVAELEARVRHG